MARTGKNINLRDLAPMRLLGKKLGRKLHRLRKKHGIKTPRYMSAFARWRVGDQKPVLARKGRSHGDVAQRALSVRAHQKVYPGTAKSKKRLSRLIQRLHLHGIRHALAAGTPVEEFSRQMIRRLRVVGARERMIQRANNTPGVSPHGAAPVRIHDKSQRIIDRIGRSGRMKKRAKMAAFLAEFARGAVYLNPAKRSVTPSDARDRVIHRLSGRALGAMKAGRRTRHVKRIQKLIGRAYKHGVKYHRRTDMSAILEAFSNRTEAGRRERVRRRGMMVPEGSYRKNPKTGRLADPGSRMHRLLKRIGPGGRLRARMDAALERLAGEFGRTSSERYARVIDAHKRMPRDHRSRMFRILDRIKPTTGRLGKRKPYQHQPGLLEAAEFATGAVYIRRNRRNPGGRIAGALVGTRGVGVIPRIKARMALKRLSKRLKAHGQYGARHNVPA